MLESLVLELNRIVNRTRTLGTKIARLGGRNDGGCVIGGGGLRAWPGLGDTPPIGGGKGRGGGGSAGSYREAMARVAAPVSPTEDRYFPTALMKSEQNWTRTLESFRARAMVAESVSKRAVRLNEVMFKTRVGGSGG